MLAIHLHRVLSEAVESKPAKKPEKKTAAKKEEPETIKEEAILKVKLVSGVKIRNTVCTDFIGGGHSLVYPKIIPEGEIWIEEELHPDEQLDILVHELVEYALMSKGGQYSPSHTLANKMERVFRDFMKVKDTVRPTPKRSPEVKRVEESETAGPPCPTCEMPLAAFKKEGGTYRCSKGHRWEMKGGQFVTPAAQGTKPVLAEGELITEAAKGKEEEDKFPCPVVCPSCKTGLAHPKNDKKIRICKNGHHWNWNGKKGTLKQKPICESFDHVG